MDQKAVEIFPSTEQLRRGYRVFYDQTRSEDYDAGTQSARPGSSIIGCRAATIVRSLCGARRAPGTEISARKADKANMNSMSEQEPSTYRLLSSPY